MSKPPALIRLYENMLQESAHSGCWDKFPQDIGSFKALVDKEAKREYGQDYQKQIDAKLGKGYVDKLVKKMFDKFWTADEAFGELGFVFDVCQGGTHFGYVSGPEDMSHMMQYPLLANCDPEEKYDHPDDGSYATDGSFSMRPRKSRPTEDTFDENGSLKMGKGAKKPRGA